MNPDIFGPEDCPNYQLSEDLTNPNKRKYCIYEKNGIINYEKTFVSRETQKGEDISFYHPEHLTENGIFVNIRLSVYGEDALTKINQIL